MNDNHTELCERLREQAEFDRKQWGSRGGDYVSIAAEAADMLEQQAARIQQQALDYVSLFDQCSQHLARIAALERKYKEAFDDCGELNTANHELLAACGEKDRRIAELEKERDALKADAGRWRIIESTLPDDELQDIAIIVAVEHGVNVANGFTKTPAVLLDSAIAAIQAEKETRS